MRLPAPVVRLVGRLQFRLPWLRAWVLRFNRHLTEGETTIRHGLGAGLRFDATGGQPGYALGTSEPAEEKLLASYLGPGSVFYDIGANIGFFSTLGGRLVEPGGSVWAFEPLAQSAERARGNAARNGFQHVTVIEARWDGNAENCGSSSVTVRLSITWISTEADRLWRSSRSTHGAPTAQPPRRTL